MKKILYWLTICFILVGCAFLDNSDAGKFKIEYEILNNRKTNSGGTYLEIKIDSNNPMVYSSVEEVMDIANKTGVIYFGFNECPWCRNAVPALVEAAMESGVEKVHYFDIGDIRDELELTKENKIKVIKEKSEDYQKIYDALYDYLDVYEGLNDETLKRIYAPTVFFFKDGKMVKKHVSTLESHMDAGIVMNELEFNVLKRIYKDGFEKIK